MPKLPPVNPWFQFCTGRFFTAYDPPHALVRESALLPSIPPGHLKPAPVPSPTQDPRVRFPNTSDSPTLTPGSVPIVKQPKVTQKMSSSQSNARPNRYPHSDDPAAHKSMLLQARPSPGYSEQDSHSTQASNLNHSNDFKQKDGNDSDPKQVGEIGLSSRQNSKEPSLALLSSTLFNAVTDSLTSVSADLGGLISGRLGHETASDESGPTVTIIAVQVITVARTASALADTTLTPKALNKTIDGTPGSSKTAGQFVVGSSRTIPLTTNKSSELSKLTMGDFRAGETFSIFLSSSTFRGNYSNKTGNNIGTNVKVFQGEAERWKGKLSRTKEIFFVVAMMALIYM